MMKIHKKRIIKKVLICLLVLFSITTGRINYLRVSQNKEPILVLKNTTIKDGGIRYYGLGYEIIHWGLQFNEHEYVMRILILFKIYP